MVLMSQRMHSLARGVQRIYYSPVFCYILIASGLILRLRHYLENRSLWLDEAYVALQVTSTTWREIFFFIPLIADVPQSPPFFYAVQKLSADIGGPSELALRFFPCLCGCAALFLFYAFLKRFARPEVVGMALALFALNPRLIYYSAEVKTYSFDLIISMGLLIFISWVHRHGYRPRHILWLGLVCGWVMWASYASMFLTASFGLWLTWISLKERNHKRFGFLFLIFLFWLLNFLALYRLSFQTMVGDEALLHMWPNGLLLHPFFSWQALVWLKQAVLNVFRNPLAVEWVYFSAAVFLAGGVALCRRRPRYFYWLVLPILLVLAASVARKYPFQGRMLLFLMPGMVLILAEGVLTIAALFKRKSAFMVFVLAGALLWHPAIRAGRHFINGYFHEDNRQVMQYLRSHYQTGDLISLTSQGFFPYLYYAYQLRFFEILPVWPDEIGEEKLFAYPFLGRFDESFFEDDSGRYLDFVFVLPFINNQGQFRQMLMQKNFLSFDEKSVWQDDFPQRVWIVFMHEPPQPIKKFILDLLGRSGPRQQALEAQGASVYLYRL